MGDPFDDFLSELGGSKVSKELGFEVFKGTDISLASHVPYGIGTRVPMLDLALCRSGWPVGRIVEMAGFESCLDANTFVQYQTRTKAGKVQNCKGGTIESLYYKFHKKGSGIYKRSETINSVYFAPSMTDQGFIQNNRIIDVVDAGTQHCYKVKTKMGLEIVATEEHKFFTGTVYRRLKNLNIGDVVIVSIGNHQKGQKEREDRPEVFVKYHPTAGTKTIENKYKYKRLRIARAAYEAHLNNLEYDEYIARLNSGNLDGLIFSDRKKAIHHVDENIHNNSKENLQELTHSEHGKLHSKARLKNLSFIINEDTIESIEHVGKRKVYDIKMLAPMHNFIANKFVVHNSGKSTLALSAVASAQRMGGYALWIDTERTFDPAWAKVNGCDPDRIIVGQVDSIEGAFTLQLNALTARANSEDYSTPLVMVTDSVTGVPSLETLDRDLDQNNRLGTDARAIRDGMRKLTGKVADTKALAIYVNHSISKTAVSTFAKQSQSSGGHAIKFYSSVRIELINCGFIKSEKNDEQYKEGIKVKIKVEKNKVASGGRLAVDVELLGNGFDLTAGLFDALVEIGEIERVNIKTYKFKVPGSDETISFSKGDWGTIVENHSSGPNAVYDWFLTKATQKGYLKAYNV